MVKKKNNLATALAAIFAIVVAGLIVLWIVSMIRG
jgi:hypothetical protein